MICIVFLFDFLFSLLFFVYCNVYNIVVVNIKRLSLYILRKDVKFVLFIVIVFFIYLVKI